MKWLSKILVAIAVLCALGYTFHRFQTCQIVGTKAPEASDPVAASLSAVRPSVKSPQADQLRYPGPSALASMKLGYEVLHTNADGSVMVLPLPPGMALQTTFMLSPAGHHNLSVVGANNKCASGIDVNVYRLDRENPVFSGSISPPPKKAPLLIDIETTKLSDPFVVTVKLARGAQNNWFCNVLFSWDSAR